MAFRKKMLLQKFVPNEKKILNFWAAFKTTADDFPVGLEGVSGKFI